MIELAERDPELLTSVAVEIKMRRPEQRHERVATEVRLDDVKNDQRISQAARDEMERIGMKI